MSTNAATRPVRAPPGAGRALRAGGASAGAGSSRCSSSPAWRPSPRSPCCPTRRRRCRSSRSRCVTRTSSASSRPTRAWTRRSSRASSTPSRASATRRRTPARAGSCRSLPATADYIAQKSGGTSSSRATWRRRRSTSPTARGTCATCWTATTATRSSRLRLQRRRGQRRQVAAGGARRGHGVHAAARPFAETREYVKRVLDARADYRKQYRRELGL